MPKFSNSSSNKLSTCHPLLQELFNEIIKHVDCTIIEGARSLEQQKEYVRTGKSQTLNSKHLKQDDGYSWAVDCLAYPLQWENWKRNYLFAGYVKGVASSMGIDIRIGADWDGDFDPTDQSFHDLPHFELVSDRRAEKQDSRDRSSGAPADTYLPNGPSEDDINMTLEDIENEAMDIDF